MIRLERKRDVLAMNLTYAEQRALEIGITIAGGADVILLDEPTAGMSKSETARFVELIREVTVGKTLLTVEHDMGVVFGLADKIAVLVYGEVIAFDTPDGGARQPARCRRPISARAWPMRRRRSAALTCCKLEDLHAYYGKSHVLHGVDIRRRRGRDRQPAGAQRLGPLDHRQGHHGHGRLRPARCDCKGQRDPAASKPYEIAHRASATCPRTATSSPSSRCTRT